MSEETETTRPADVAGRLDGLVSAALFGTAATNTAPAEPLTIEKMRAAMALLNKLPPPMPRIVESALMVEDGEPYEKPRTWKERLFTRPWRPLKATRWVMPQVPRSGAIQLPDGTLVMHPTVAAKVRSVLGANAAHEPPATKTNEGE